MATIDKPQLVTTRLRDAQRRIVRRLQIVRNRLRLHLLVEGLFWIVLAVVGFVLASFAIDRLLRLSLSSRVALAGLAVAAIGVLAARRLVKPLLVRLDDLDLAELLDRRRPGVGQQICNVLQLPELLAHHDASPSMVESAVLECASQLDRVELTGTLNVARRRKLLAGIVACVALVAALAAFFPSTAGLWTRRWLMGSDVRWPQQTYLTVAGLGDRDHLLVPRGESTLVQIDSQPKFTVLADGRWQLTGRGEPLVVEGDAPPTSAAPAGVTATLEMSDGS